MLDLPCPHCGEPWDNDTLHDSEFIPYDEAFRKFKAYGCGAFDEIHYGRLPYTCDNTPIYTDEYMSSIRAGWRDAEYPEDIAMWIDMLDAVADGFEF